MATALSYSSETRHQNRILNEFKEITGLKTDDAIPFLHFYDWNLDEIVDGYYDEIESHEKSNHDPSLGRYYATHASSKQHDEDNDRHYSELLNSYDNVNRWEAKKDVKETEPIYHEKQRLMRCGLHSLNNLFQIPKLFTARHLEKIVREYDKRKFFNDYRTLWLGNYDLRILIEVINRLGFNVRQIDVDHNESLDHHPWNSYFGLLINLNQSHWFTIKNLNGIYYNLDSTLRKPLKIGNKDQLVDYLFRLIYKTRRIYIFIVVPKECESI